MSTHTPSTGVSQGGTTGSARFHPGSPLPQAPLPCTCKLTPLGSVQLPLVVLTHPAQGSAKMAQQAQHGFTLDHLCHRLLHPIHTGQGQALRPV
eukprot:1137624-Pelagomonas_calceolata.AAC.6